MQFQYLRITFDTLIRNWEIPWFRGAVAEKLGHQHEWYHNHANIKDETAPGGFRYAENKFHYRYPKIQYKSDRRGGKLRPMMVFSGECVQEAKTFFEQQNFDIYFKNEVRNLGIYNMDFIEYDLDIWAKEYEFNLFNWIPFTEENYQKFKNARGVSERSELMDKILTHQIVYFAQAHGLDTRQEAFAYIDEISKEGWMSLKHRGPKLKSFNLSFRTNINLPEYLGIGQGSSKGFGVVRFKPE